MLYITFEMFQMKVLCLIKYFMSPSNVSIGGVKITGGDTNVAEASLNNVDKTITITPAETYNENNTSTFISITSNDGTCNIVLKIN